MITKKKCRNLIYTTVNHSISFTGTYLMKKDQIKQQKVEQTSAPTLLTQDEYIQLMKADKRDKVNQVLRGAGIIFIIILYLVMAEFLLEISIFGLLFPSTKDEHIAFWKFMSTDIHDVIIPGVDPGEGKIFDDWWQMGVFLPKLGLTIVLILATVGVAFLVAYSISDIIGIIKNLAIGSHKTMKDIVDVAQEGLVEEFADDVSKKKVKKLFDEKDKDPIKQKVTKADKKKIKEEALEKEYNDLLDMLLTNQNSAETNNKETVETQVSATRVDN